MGTLSIGLAAGGWILTMGTWVAYLGRVPSGRVPARPVGSVVSQVAAIVLALAAVAWGVREGGAVALGAYVVAGMALVMGGLFLWLLTQRKTPLGDLRVKEGDTLMPFEAVTSDGVPFSTASLAGRRTLLKFFRGHW